MAYTPKTWQCNDTITAEDLNHIEQGIAEASSGGGTTLVGTLTRTVQMPRYTYTLDKTWAEVKSALDNGQIVLANYASGDNTIVSRRIYSASNNNDSYNAIVDVEFLEYGTGSSYLMSAESENDYLVCVLTMQG